MSRSLCDNLGLVVPLLVGLFAMAAGEVTAQAQSNLDREVRRANRASDVISRLRSGAVSSGAASDELEALRAAFDVLALGASNEARAARSELARAAQQDGDGALKDFAVRVRLQADGVGLEDRAELRRWLIEISRDRDALSAIASGLWNASDELAESLVPFAETRVRAAEDEEQQFLWVWVLRSGGPEGIRAAIRAADDGLLSQPVASFARTGGLRFGTPVRNRPDGDGETR